MTALPQYLRSLTCDQFNPSALMASTHLSFRSSSETPRIVKFLCLTWLNAATTLGFSCLQGPHQLAQKSTSTYLPFKELSLISLPFTSGNAKSGAAFPIHLDSFTWF